MIAFERMTVWQRILRLIPAQRRKQDASLKAAINQLCDDPALPCMIDGKLIPDGFGGRD